MTALATPPRTTFAAPVRIAVLAVLAAVLVTAGLATIAPAGLGVSAAVAAGGDVSWTVRTGTGDFGDNRTSFSYNVNPGGKVEDTLVVANHGKSPLALGVYTADGYTTESGQFDLVTRDAKSVGVGSWVRAARDSVTVPPGKSVSVPFTVSVPANATPGDHAGGIITSLVQASDTETINVDRRLGIRIKLRVGGDLKPTMAIENLHVDYTGSANPFAKGSATITYTIHNTGNAILSAQPTAAVSGPFGLFKTQAKAAEGEVPQSLLPGESWKMTAKVNGVTPAVRLASTATITPLITDASGSTTSLKPVQVTSHGWAVSWTLGLLVLLVLAIAVAGPVLLRRRRARRKSAEDARVQEAVDQALRKSLA
jgi:hypothetical protein